MATAKQDPKNAKKPENIIEKIVMGGIEKYYKEICLLQQAYVKGEGEDVAAHVAAVSKAVGTPVTVKSYVRLRRARASRSAPTIWPPRWPRWSTADLPI